MTAVKEQSLQIATEEACHLWGLCGAQYVESDLLLRETSLQIIRSLSAFALNGRRVLENFGKNQKFSTTVTPWNERTNAVPWESDLWESVNLVIHAKELKIQFATLDQGTYISNAKVVHYASVSTDQRSGRAISPFAMAYSFVQHVIPKC